MMWCPDCDHPVVGSDGHRCPPLWRVLSADDDGDTLARTVFAPTSAEAAEAAVHDDFWSDPSDASMLEDLDVKVRRVEAGGDWEFFVVSGEATVEFSARKKG